MFAQAIWLAAICLEGLLIFRIWRVGHFRAYPLFFSYIIFVALQDILRYLVGHRFPPYYPGVYWATEFLGVCAGCAVVLEIYRIGLQQFPGAARVALAFLLATFCLTVGKVLLTAVQGTSGWSGRLIVQLERDMRLVQTIAILSLLFVFLCYLIPVGRNLLGVILGYGFFIGINVVNLSYLEHFGKGLQSVASGIQSSAYFLALCAWTALLWSYSPQPTLSPDSSGYRYDDVMKQTERRMANTRSDIHDSLHI